MHTSATQQRWENPFELIRQAKSNQFTPPNPSYYFQFGTVCNLQPSHQVCETTLFGACPKPG